MQSLEVSCAVRPIYESLGAKRLNYAAKIICMNKWCCYFVWFVLWFKDCFHLIF